MTAGKAGRPMLPAAPGLGSELRAARLKKGLTLRQLDAACGVSYGRISQLEHGQNVTLRTLTRVARALNLQVELTLRPLRK